MSQARGDRLAARRGQGVEREEAGIDQLAPVGPRRLGEPAGIEIHPVARAVEYLVRDARRREPGHRDAEFLGELARGGGLRVLALAQAAARQAPAPRAVAVAYEQHA